MRRFTLLTISLISAVCLHAQTAGDLDASFEKARKEFDAVRKEFADSADAALAAYLEYEAKLFEEYQQFRAEVMRTWGDSVMVESTRKAWVEYSDDRTSRSSTVINVISAVNYGIIIYGNSVQIFFDRRFRLRAKLTFPYRILRSICITKHADVHA